MYTCTTTSCICTKMYTVTVHFTYTLYIHLFHFSSFEEEVYNEWVSGVNEVAKTNLEKPLLVWEKKESMELVKVNFDPKVHVHCTCICKCHTMYTMQTMFIHMYMYISAHFMYTYGIEANCF